MSDAEKICTMCGLSFPATPEYFYTAFVNGKAYLRGMCIECNKTVELKKYLKARDRVLERCHEYYKEKKELIHV